MSATSDESGRIDELRRRLIAKTLANDPAVGAPAQTVRPTDRNVDLPLSLAQERMWLSHSLSRRNHIHVLDLAYRLDAALDRDALQVALDAVVERHEVLRTSIVSGGGRPVQRVAAPSRVSVEWRHAAGSTALALGQVEKFVQQPFDVAAPPLIRAGVWSHPTDTLLVLTLPHLVCDALSADILVREVVDAYRACCRGELVFTKPLDLQFGDYAAWQRTRMDADGVDKLLTHWTTRLAEPPVVSIPTDYTRPSLPSGRGGVEEVRLSRTVRSNVERLAGEQDATPFMVLLAAYFTVISEWSGQDDIVVGTPSAGRTLAELSGLVGMFVDTLPIRASLGRNDTFRQVLARLRTRVLDAFDHQELPFEQMVRALNRERDLSRHPIFQIWFVLQGEIKALEASGSATFVPVDVHREDVIAPFDISLMITPTNGELQCHFTYARDLFDPATVAQMATHFAQVVDTATNRPDIRISHLSQAQGADQSALRALGRGQLQSAIEPRPWIADRLGTALIHAQGTLDYGELVKDVEGLVASLEAHGVPTGALIGIYVPRSAWSIIAMYAIWQFGGAFVHLDAGLPQARLRHLVDVAGIRWAIVDESTAGQALGHGLNVVSVTPREGAAATPNNGRHRELRIADSHSMAYAIFTSGSTGMPKAVSVGRAAVDAHVAAAIERYGIEPTDCVLAFASFSFDAVLDQVLTAISAGASVVLGEHGQILPSELSKLIAENGITVANLPPSYWVEWVNTMGPGSRSELSSLRLLILGGEAIDPATLSRWRDLAPHVVVLNAYGPTETTITATVMDVSTSRRLRAPIGRPLGNRTVYVVDPDLELSPRGAPGELLIGGPELALGYLSNAAQTAERFIPDVFGDSGGRLFRTGDRVRWLGDGNLEFLGRIDDQLKVRGFRVEPSEVEEVLSRCPGVRSAAVVLAADAQSLNAFIVGETIRVSELRQWCRDQLPSFMVPSRFQLVDEFPRGATGKLDRTALSAVENVSARDQGDPYCAPRSDAERALCKLWIEVLGVDDVGIDDGFFDLGGHSLVAATVVAQVSKRLGKRLELRQLFENPTVRQFAALLPAAETAESDSMIHRAGRAQLPMSAAQERLWFLDRVSDAGQEYLMWFAWRVHGPVNRVAWERALNDLIERHEVLRTGLVDIGGIPTQVVHQSCTARVEWTSVPDLPAAEAGASQFVRKRFDLQSPPLIRTSGWSVGDEENVLAISLHHVVADGWSKKILLEEFFHFYKARTHEQEPKLAALPIQYGDYALWESRKLDGARTDTLVEYWTSQLSDLEALDLHHDRSRPATRTSSGELHMVTIADELLCKIDNLRLSGGVTRFMVFLAAFQVVLGRWSGHDDVAVGTPVAGRNHPDLEPLIGFFANSVVLRSSLGANPTFAQLLENVRATVLDAFDHQELPFGQVVEALQPERSLTRNPLFDVMFDVQEEPSATPYVAGLQFEVVDLDWESSKFDLTCSVVMGEGDAQVHFEYDCHLFDRVTVERLASHFIGVLESVSTAPHEQVLSVEMSGTAERELVARFSSSATCASSSPLRLSTGERTAVICGELELTYAELDAMVGGLAHALNARGIVRGSHVAVLVARGVWPLVSMLAIWRLGAVLVPLDSGTPEPRLRYIMMQSLVEHVIVDKDDAAPWAASRIDVRDVQTIASFPACDLRPEDPAYIIFTSGTSGRPKGVLVQHSALWQHVADARALLAMVPDDRVLSFSSSAFDAYFEQVLPTLASGACLIIRPEQLWTVRELAYVVRTHGVTVMELTPAYWSQVAAELADVSSELRSLRRVVSGGDVLSAATVEQWNRYMPNAPILNTYGPTEATISSTAYDIVRHDGRRIPIGRPIGPRRLYVVDRAGGGVPIGVPGELLIGGECLAHGYVGDPKGTASAFVPDWFENQGGRLYRTGDLVKWLPDGDLEFLGRIDDQVKIRGFRIEPQEVAHVIREMDDVRDVLVSVDDSTDDRLLVAYVSGDDILAEDVEAWCRRMLPSYMIPAHFEVLSELPLTRQGKVDQRRLPRVVFDENDDDHRPSSATEIVVAQLWSEVLGTRRLGRDSNFFQVGGHSIRAVSAVARVNRTFETQLRVNDLFTAPTVRGFARRIEIELEAQVLAMADSDLDLAIGPQSDFEDRI